MRVRHDPPIHTLKMRALKAIDQDAARQMTAETRGLGPLHQVKEIEARRVLAGEEGDTPELDAECEMRGRDKHGLCESVVAEADACRERLNTIELKRQRSKRAVENAAAQKNARALREMISDNEGKNV